ncbi:MAG: hypothetical protein ACRDSF_16280 [Pseudonocardiaceae bacterium]
MRAFPHADPAQHVTVRVVVIVNGLHYGGRDHRYLDELVRSPRSNYPCSSVSLSVV